MDGDSTSLAFKDNSVRRRGHFPKHCSMKTIRIGIHVETSLEATDVSKSWRKWYRGARLLWRRCFLISKKAIVDGRENVTRLISLNAK